MAFLNAEYYKSAPTVMDYLNQNRKMEQESRANEQALSAGDEKIKMQKAQRAAKMLSMATPENWQSIRSQAIQEGLGSEESVPRDYDPQVISKLQQAFGEIGGNVPASIQNFSLYKTLNPEDQALFDRANRGVTSNYLNLGGAYVNPNTGVSLPITPKASEMPDFEKDVAAAKQVGEAEGKAAGAKAKKELQAPQIEELLKKAEELLPKATSGGAGVLKRDVYGFFGEPTSGSAADSSLDVVGAALTAGVPRMEGPQSNYDVKLYEKAAGDLANPKLPIATRQAALATIRELNNKYIDGVDTKQAVSSAEKTIVKTQISPSTGKRKIIYSDGTEEIQ